MPGIAPVMSLEQGGRYLFTGKERKMSIVQVIVASMPGTVVQADLAGRASARPIDRGGQD